MALAVAIAGLASRAHADSPGPPAPVAPKAPHVEMWTGGQAFADVWSVYAGASWAPFGSVREDGFRLRAVLGTGAYENGRVTFADVLIGYHKQHGAVTFKIFGGLTVADHSPATDTSMLDGTALGPKAVAETWWNITDKAWTSLDLAIALPFMHASMVDAVDRNRIEYNGRLRLGWRLLPDLSIGLEGGAGGPLAPTLQTTWQSGTTYAGGFLRYEWSSGEVSISGGVATDGDAREEQTSPFATVSVLTRF